MLKNRLIYWLITLMVVSTIGTISLQGIWISNAFEDRQREYDTHINDALNAVNDDIDEDEAELFIERTFGGLDSLLDNIIILENQNFSDSERVIIEDETPGRQHRLEIKFIDTLRSDEHVRTMEDKIVWNEHVEFRADGPDSLLKTIIDLENRDHHIEHITNVVRHRTTERIHGGQLHGRLSKEDLDEKISLALKQEGISDPYDFAIFDHNRKEFDTTFSSKGFLAYQTSKQFRKPLFQHDRIYAGNYSLYLNMAEESTFVWNRVRPMILLSILFTLLILFCFSYALYFIFKQKKISQVKNDFINNMTHELKTPLASISLAASSIKHPEVIHKPKEIEHFVEIIESEERRINAHIEHVLDIASLDKSELQLNFASEDLIYILKESMKRVDLSLSESNGTSSLICSLENAPVEADAFHLINVFSNVLDNSIKYRAEILKIQVELTRHIDMYQVSIRDNGIGMSSKTQQLAFDKFFRAETGDVHNRKGFGLGLSYVKSIVEAHNGTVTISSELNKGTTVIILIPAKP